MTDRRKYTDKFKAEAAELVLSSGRPIAQVAVDIGVNEGTLGNWVRKYREEHPDRFADEEKAPVSWEEHQRALAQVAELRQVEFLGKVRADPIGRRNTLMMEVFEDGNCGLEQEDQ